jgi:hypothetical protein
LYHTKGGLTSFFSFIVSRIVENIAIKITHQQKADGCSS